jgi:hypothetical protein
MKEKLYSIPVNDAFKADCECPVCQMRKTLEDDAVSYTMGPSYMEDDTRMQTDRLGFCQKHMSMIYASGNKLGISLILKTHFDYILKNSDELSEKVQVKKGFLANKKSCDAADSPFVSFLNELNHSCFVCSRINNFFDRYMDTVFYLWKNDTSFKETFSSCKGFCSEHCQLLLQRAPLHLSGATLDEFLELVKELYTNNMQRVRDDLAWFIDKFDYRNNDAPWKNSKDSIPRAMTKECGIIIEDR